MLGIEVFKGKPIIACVSNPSNPGKLSAESLFLPRAKRGDKYIINSSTQENHGLN